MKMIIIRHGQTDANLEGIVQGIGIDMSLNSVGTLQAETLGFNLKQYNITEIYSSTMKRANETSEILSKYSGAKIFLWPGLEEVHFGDAEGMKSDDARQKYKDIFEKVDDDVTPDFDISIPNGESVNQNLERVIKALKAIKLVSTQPVVAVVTHGAVMYNLYRKFYKIKKRFDNCEFFELEA